MLEAEHECSDTYSDNDCNECSFVERVLAEDVFVPACLQFLLRPVGVTSPKSASAPSVSGSGARLVSDPPLLDH